MKQPDDIRPTVIGVHNVTKTFKLPHERVSSLKTAILNFYRRRTFEQQKTLKNVTFEVKKGEFFGIVGRNGSGKSTLLKLLAGIYTPNKGQIHVEGRLTPFIELGVGFNPELTGRENVFLNGALLGFGRKEMLGMYDDIVEFAELKRFMDQKLKNYSSGMQVRLAFSIAIRADSDILLIDEVLAVGDATFQKKCFDYFKELKKQKKTVIFVSHDSNALEEYCDRGVLLEAGKVQACGKIQSIVREYNELLNAREEQAEERVLSSEKEMADKQRWGTGRILVKKVVVEDGISQKSKHVFADKDESIDVRVIYKASEAIEDPVYGITIADAAGERIFQSNTMWADIKTRTVSPNELVNVRWSIPNIFNTGTFSISPAVADSRGDEIFDWCQDEASFKVRKQLLTTAYANVPHDIVVTSPESKDPKQEKERR